MTQQPILDSARRLWTRNGGGTSSPEEVGAATIRVGTQLRTGLTRWVGAEGYRALLERAHELAAEEHPALRNVPCDDGDQEADVNYLGRVAGILPRFKPAGIRAYTDTARDTWVLGRSVIRGPDATDGEGIERNVTRVQGPLADGFVPLDRPQP